jgi:hypothetical protein
MSAPAESDIDLMRATLADKGDWFRRVAGAERRRLEWRAMLDFPIEVVAREARSADLVVVARERAPGSAYRVLDPGRPTLVVPEGVSSLAAEHAMIGWTDTREARRAVRDAIALLQRAAGVTLVEACAPDDEDTALQRLDDVAEKGRLQGTLWGEPVDVERHAPACEPKGATYTALRVAKGADGNWSAACIVDV